MNNNSDNQNIDNENHQIFDTSKIKLIVGLGNIGREYINTRHNIGFEFVETLAKTSKFNEEKKFKAYLHQVEINGYKIYLAKPTTMMNMSGESVNLISKYYNIEPNEILIAHDDLDLKLGSYKIQFSKGPRIHNGILSIENRLGTTKFWRLRIGVDNRYMATKDLMSGASYVLSTFKPDELNVVSKVIYDIIESL